MRAVVVTLLALLAMEGTSTAQLATRGATVDYRGTGVVVALLPPPSSLHQSRPVVIIHHEPIPGLMDETMSMPFIAESTDLFRGLQPGDRIAFGLRDTPGALLVVVIERLPARR